VFADEEALAGAVVAAVSERDDSHGTAPQGMLRARVCVRPTSFEAPPVYSGSHATRSVRRCWCGCLKTWATRRTTTRCGIRPDSLAWPRC
jgi:hypothetical protein